MNSKNIYENKVKETYSIIDKLSKDNNENIEQLKKAKNELCETEKESLEFDKLNEQLNDELSSLCQENANYKVGLAKTRSEHKNSQYKKLEDENSKLTYKLNKQNVQMKRLEMELMKTKQNIAEALNIMHELEEKGLYECEISFKAAS